MYALEHQRCAQAVGVKVDTVDSGSQTALDRAFDKCYDSVARLLIERGAEINAKDANNEMPLQRAQRSHFESLMRSFIVLEASPQATGTTQQ